MSLTNQKNPLVEAALFLQTVATALPEAPKPAQDVGKDAKKMYARLFTQQPKHEKHHEKHPHQQRHASHSRPKR